MDPWETSRCRSRDIRLPLLRRLQALHLRTWYHALGNVNVLWVPSLARDKSRDKWLDYLSR